MRGAKKSPAALAGGAAALGGTPRHSEAPGSPGRRRAASRIRRGPQGPMARVRRGGQGEPETVALTLGVSMPEGIEVTAGLSPGDVVLAP